MPSMLSFTLDCENGEEIVGLRLRADQMTIEALLRQYDVKLVAQSLLERKAVTKWTREETAISFSEVEGRALYYCSLATSKMLAKKSQTDLVGWVFREDNFNDLTRLSLHPCIWAPKVDFIMNENSKQFEVYEKTASLSKLL